MFDVGTPVPGLAEIPFLSFAGCGVCAAFGAAVLCALESVLAFFLPTFGTSGFFCTGFGFVVRLASSAADLALVGRAVHGLVFVLVSVCNQCQSHNMFVIMDTMFTNSIIDLPGHLC